ncbi:MAG: LacI family DNA-binding transcriptional regulator [Clostridia bacterium]
MRDLAKRAGVSIATVSRVMNHPQHVQADTRDHVLKVMQETGYVALHGKKTPKESFRSNLIVLLLSESDYGFYEPIQKGFEAIARERGYCVLFCPLSDDSARRIQQLTALCSQRPDGVAYAMRDIFKEDMELFKSFGVPVVLLRKYIYADEFYNCCYINFSEGSYRMTKYLIELGHKKIVLLVEKASFQFVESFRDGWERAYRESKLSCSNDWVVHTENSVEGGYEKSLALMRAGEAPEAFFCASGELAFGVLRAARELKISVPEQISVSGFTDSAMAHLSEPELTTIDQPIERLGVVAARMLFDLIEDPGHTILPAQEIVLQPKIRIRKSCGKHVD